MLSGAAGPRVRPRTEAALATNDTGSSREIGPMAKDFSTLWHCLVWSMVALLAGATVFALRMGFFLNASTFALAAGTVAGTWLIRRSTGRGRVNPAATAMAPDWERSRRAARCPADRSLP